MKNPGRSNRAETMWCKIVPYRNKIKEDCTPHIKLILLVNKWRNPWHALQDLEKEIPSKRLKELKKVIGL